MIDNTILRIISHLLVGFLLTFIGVLFQKWLARKGVVRESIIPIVIVTFILIVVKLIWFTDLSWGTTLLIVLLANTFGINGPDLWTTLNRGCWWWRETLP